MFIYLFDLFTSRTFCMVTSAIVLSGCGTLNSMVSDFETRWDDPEAALKSITAESSLSDEMKETLEADVVTASNTFQHGECKSVVKMANKVLSYKATHFEANFVLAECDLRQNDFASARQRFLQLSETFNDYRVQRGLGLAYLRGGEIEGAKAHLLNALEMAGGDWRTLNALGFVEDKYERWDAAEAAYLTAAHAALNEAAPLNNLGMSYMQQARYKEAAEVFSQAVNRDNENNVVEVNHRIALAHSGDLASAFAGASNNERAVILNNLGIKALSSGEVERAKKYFRRALDESPRFYASAYDNLERAKLLTPKQ